MILCCYRACNAIRKLLSLYQEPPADKLSSEQLVGKREFLVGMIALTMGRPKEEHKKLLLFTKELAENRKLLTFLQEYMNNNNSIDECALLLVSA